MEVEYKITIASDTVNRLFITDEEIQSFLRLPDFDLELTILRDAAIRMAERYMNRAITEQIGVVRSEMHSFRMPYIPFGGSLNITSIESAGEDVQVWNYDEVTGYLSVDSDLPLPLKVNVKYETNVDGIPAAIKLAILKIIATEYEMRESVSIGVSINEATNSATRILDLYRLPSGSIY